MGRAMDRISELPDTVRLQILSLLPRKYAVRTSLLSQRWRDLWRFRWPYSTTLDFGEDFSRGRDLDEVVKSINQVIDLRSGKKVEIFLLSLCYSPCYKSDVLRWIDYAIANGVEELYLDMHNGRIAEGHNRSFVLPDCVFNGEKLTTLSLRSCEFGVHSEFKRIRMLETLCLTSVGITDRMLEDVIASCPLLEKLYLRQCHELRSIRVCKEDLRLKSLMVINCRRANEIDILAPKLRSFYFNGEFIRRYLFRNVASLEDVTISSAGWEAGSCITDWLSMVPTIANVKVLTLCSRAIQYIAVLKISEPTLFSNLKELQMIMELMTETNLSDIYDFFRKCHCPRLNKISIELPTGSRDPALRMFLRVFEEESTECDLGNLKIIKMRSFKGHKNEMELVRFFLDKASALEYMILATAEEKDLHDGGMDFNCSTISQALESLKFFYRASVNAKIVIQPPLED